MPPVVMGLSVETPQAPQLIIGEHPYDRWKCWWTESRFQRPLLPAIRRSMEHKRKPPRVAGSSAGSEWTMKSPDHVSKVEPDILGQLNGR